MIRVISSFADGPVNFHSTGPAEDQIQKLISSTGCMRESVANKMLWAEDYQKIRTLHQLYLFVSSALFSSENEKSESEDRFERVVHAVPSNVAFFA